MVEPRGTELPVNIEDEMRASYLDYAMSVIIGRALPDIRDGLSLCTDASSTPCRSCPTPLIVLTRSQHESLGKSLESIILTAMRRSTTPWFAWLRVSRCARSWWTVRGTLAQSTGIPRRPCATPKSACHGSLLNFWLISTKERSISFPTTTNL